MWSLDELVREASRRARRARPGRASRASSPLVDVDAVQIQRVLANLIENALKFSPPASRVHVRITATRQEAIVRVVDQGPGLPEEELERVFEPFYRRPATGSGAGLGLAIARGFAAANGGRVWAESRPGQGATFALALPVVEVPVELQRMSQRILVVDDEPQILRALGTTLRGAGYTVDTADDGRRPRSRRPPRSRPTR